jgi:hypothetical protein
VSRRASLLFGSATLVSITALLAVALPGSASVAGRNAGPGRTPVPALVAPLAAGRHLSHAQAVTASATCLRYASGAGWADNGHFSGDLVTATAVCVSESRGDPNLIVCDNGSGKIVGQGDYPAFTCPEPATVSYDRGLWQLNTAVPGAVSNTCAFNPVCNAGAAYLASQRGTDFAPWASYDQDFYARYIDPVQMRVNALTAGTVASAELGECLAQGRSVAGAKVVIVNCGSGSARQQWSFGGGKLRSGALCAAIASLTRTPGVVLARCARGKRQQEWKVAGRFELRNVADGKCLTDPGGNLTAGTQVRATRCANAKDQTWWRS